MFESINWKSGRVWLLASCLTMPVSIIQAADDSAGVESENATAGHVAAIERGNYLLRAGGCYACHTDAADGGKPLAGGPGLHTEFGTFYAPNLTPDMEHGIGEWTLDQFRQALHKGLSPDGKPYYPVFPYDFYTRLNDQDVNDLWAALQAVPTSSTPDQQHDVSFPYSIRSGLSLWQSIFFREGRFRANPDNGEMFNRGAYLVNGPAHCAACHTPRNSYGALDWSRHLQGADNLPGGERSPTIRARVLKARGWTVESLARALKNGVQPAGDRFLGSMAEVVELGTSYLSEKDRRAIATYILTEPRRR